jgi:hypothetical protein
MEKVRPFLLTAFTQLGYFALLLQAFVIPPPLKSFRPCGCSTYAPTIVKRLILLHQLPTSRAAEEPREKSKIGAGDRFCPMAGQNAAPPVLNNLQLDSSLEQLLFKHSAQITLCLSLDAQGNVLDAATCSVALSDKDQRLIARYVTQNWKFLPERKAGAGPITGHHRMTLAIHQEAIW